MISPLACFAQAVSPNVLDDVLTRLPPYIVTLSVGPTFAGNGETQTFYLVPFIKKTYAADKKINVLFDGELFFGVVRELTPSLQGELGLELGVTSDANLSGDIWDFANARFNNSSYTYKIQHTHLAVKGKIVGEIGYPYKPYVHGSLGVGFNQAYDFKISPSIFAEVIPPNFTSTLTTAFTYTVGFGVQRAINEHWTAGVGYEFSDWGKSQLGRSAGQTLGKGIALNHFYTNGIQLTISYHGQG